MILSGQGRSILQKQPLIEGLNEEEVDLLLKLLDEKDFTKDAILIRKGDFSDELYLLVDGAITFSKHDIYDPSRLVTYRLHAPATWGESSFLNPGPHPFDIYAQEDHTHLFILHRRQLEDNSIGNQVLNKILLNLIRLDLEGSRALPLAINKESLGENKERQKQISLKRLKQEMLIKWLPKEWSSRERKEIEELVDIKHLAPQETCIRKNDSIDCFYLLIEGQLNVLDWDAVQNHPILIEVLNPGDQFGENSILKPLLSPYTIEAHQPSTLLLLERKKLEQNVQHATIQKLLLHLAQYNPDQSYFIKKNYGEIPTSIHKEGGLSVGLMDHLEFLHRHWMMKELSSEEVESIDRVIQVKEFRPGAKIIHKQSPIRDLYFILQGEAALQSEERMEEMGIERMQPGDVLGEFGFLTGRIAPYSAQATTKMEVAQLSFEGFKDLLSSGQGNYLNIMTRCAQLMQQRLEHFKKKEGAALHVKNQQLIRKKFFWLLSIFGLILSFLELYKAFGNIPAFIITLLQVFIPVLLIHTYLKESLKNWGWNWRFIGRSLLQALICIALFGGGIEFIGQIIDLPTLHFFSPGMWRNMAFSLSSIIDYFLFVVLQEWLRRGIVALSLQRGLENGRGWLAALLSSLLFVGFPVVNSPFFVIGLFIKDFILAKLFLRAPHLLGVILIHFVLGVFFAYLGWYTL